jgi:hypothetical protein
MKTIKLLSVMGLILLISSFALAQETKRTATIIDIKGSVEVKTPKANWVPAKTGMVLTEGDIIKTKKNSHAILNLDGMAETATVEVKENSQLMLSQLLEDRATKTQSTLLDLALGEILIQARKLHSEKSKFEVKTPTSVVAVRGTTFSVAVEAVE